MHIAKLLQWFMLVPSHSYWIGRKKEIKREQSMHSHVGACHWLTNFIDRSSGKTMELGGLHHNWKQRAQVPSQHQPSLPTIALSLTKSHSNCQDQTSNPTSDGVRIWLICSLLLHNNSVTLHYNTTLHFLCGPGNSASLVVK